MSSKKSITEVDAYAYIKKELAHLGWDTRDPSKVPQGQVYTQNQCFNEPEMKKWLDKKRPEYIVKVNETNLWVIEAKSKRTEIDQALDEAQNYYATRLNQSKTLKVSFISGVAGNDLDGYIIKNRFLDNGVFEPILLNDKEMTGLLSPEISKRVLDSCSSELRDIPIDQAFFMKKAERINEILHLGAVNINDRARVMAALLLSTLQGDLPDLNADPTVLIRDINTRSETALAKEGKKEFAEYVRLSLPTSLDNHQKYKKALVDTLKELYSLNIRSAMNSGSDILGQFYEVFLKYGNWAQKMGIVLTPRHITRFVAEALDVTLQDIVLDPCCGTGGFLVAAFDYIKRTANKNQIDNFKKNNIFGIDQQPQLVCLAIVNMMFRGDGKNNLIEGDCFTKWLESTIKEGIATASYTNKEIEEEKKAVTKVLMNPSFAIKVSDIREYRFIQHALRQIVDGGQLFSVLPVGAMLEGGEELDWRTNTLLKENTLVSVITFPPELFYPIGVHTLGVIIRKGVPHLKNRKVLWVRAIHDGMSKVKGVRLPTENEPNNLTESLPIVKAFIHDPLFPIQNISGLYQTSEIDFEDDQLELIPEVYLDSVVPTAEEINEAIETNIRDVAAFLIRNNSVIYAKSIKEESIGVIQIKKEREVINRTPELKMFKVTDFFEPIRGDFHALSKLEKGDTPTVSRISDNNGVVGYYKKPSRAKLYSPLKLTVSTVTGDTFVQLVPFIATDNVLILQPRKEWSPEALFFVQAMINREKWRCTYGRQLYKEKFSKTRMYLPIDENGKINEPYMKEVVQGCSYWGILEPHIKIIKTTGSYV